jgi:hypothetical protein
MKTGRGKRGGSGDGYRCIEGLRKFQWRLAKGRGEAVEMRRRGRSGDGDWQTEGEREFTWRLASV